MINKHTALAALAIIAGLTPAHADITISTAATQNITCSGGVCAPTATDAVLNVTDLEGYLASGNIEVTTADSGVDAENIDIETGLTWANSSVLSLVASQAIKVDQPVSVTGVGGLSITTDGQNEDFSFASSGHITFSSLSSSLTVNGAAYTLVNSVQGLASAISADPSGAFALAADFDASNDGTYKQSPVDTDFYGSVQGLGHQVSRVKFGGKAVGLFRYLDTGSTVTNLRLSNINARAKSSFGGLAYFVYQGVIEHCSVSGSIQFESNEGRGIAGLASGNNGTISDSWSSVQITGKRKNALLAGLVADNFGTIQRSWTTGSISVNTKLPSGPSMAGLVATSEPGSSISDSYAELSVTGIGEQTGTVTGGLEGTNHGAVSSSYSTGAIKNVGGSVGGLIGYDQAASGSLSDTYWDTKTSGITNPAQGAGYPLNDPGITGLTTKQFKSGLPAGFDSSVWAEDAKINNGLPYLIANPPPN